MSDFSSTNLPLMEDASQIPHVSQKMPPALLIVGENDFPMLEADARSFGSKAGGMGSLGMTDKRDFVLDTVLMFLKTQVTK